MFETFTIHKTILIAVKIIGKSLVEIHNEERQYPLGAGYFSTCLKWIPPSTLHHYYISVPAQIGSTFACLVTFTL